MMNELLATQEFATLPQVTIKVLDLLENDESFDLRELSKLIETDASLTFKLIRVANSPLFAIRGSIASVQQAVMTLGLNRVTNIVLGISIFSKFICSTNKEMEKIIEKYLWHTSSVGVVSKSIAEKIGLHFKEQEFIGGLLHDIGKLAMLQYNYQLFQEVIRLIEEENLIDLEAENAIFEVDHISVGIGIAKLWRLPKDLSLFFQYKKDFLSAPNDSVKNMTAIINVANLLCEIWGADFYGGHKSIDFQEVPEWQHIEKISKDKNLDFELITFDLESDYRKSETFLKIITE